MCWMCSRAASRSYEAGNVQVEVCGACGHMTLRLSGAEANASFIPLAHEPRVKGVIVLQVPETPMEPPPVVAEVLTA